jgi:hypothetical protein
VIDSFTAWSPHRRLITLGLAASVIVLSLVAALLLTSSRTSDRAAPNAPTKALPAPSASAVPGPTPTAPSAALRPLPRTNDPVTYARDVAGALFGVSPVTLTRPEFLTFWQGELPSVVYADAATKGLTLAAQNADVIDNLTTSWIPPQPAWDSEAAEYTMNRFTITSVSVPDYWVNAVADGTFTDPGLHMERVMGVLTQRYGADPARQYTSSRSVVIDLGLLCRPTQAGGCRLVAPQQPPDLGDS